MRKIASSVFCLCLAVAVCSGASGQDQPEPKSVSASHGQIVLTRAKIIRIKALLHLKPEQLRYWQAIESALREMSPHGGHGVALASKPIVLDQAKLATLAAAAMPLLMALGPEQRREASALGRAMGVRLSSASY